MKFPFELSEQRLSILSAEDKALYEYEHSPFFSITEKEEAVRQYQKAMLERQGYYLTEINNDDDYVDMSENDKILMAEELAKLESKVIIDELYSILAEYMDDGLTQEDMNAIKEIVISELNTPAESLNESQLNEADGHDMTYWMNNMGWLGKLAGSLLTGIFGGMVALIMAGKTKAAVQSLENYMNKLVELTDDGVHKKKSIIGALFSKLGVNKRDQERACFRDIQEKYSKEIACNVMTLVKGLGFVGPKCDAAIQDIENKNYNNGGLSYFYNIAEQVNRLSNNI